MNPAALKTNIGDLVKGGLLIVDKDEFTPANLKKASYEDEPARGRQPFGLPAVRNPHHPPERNRPRRNRPDRQSRSSVAGTSTRSASSFGSTGARWRRRSLGEEKFAPQPGGARCQPARAPRRPQLRRDRRRCSALVQGRAGSGAARHLPAHQRQRGDGAGVRRSFGSRAKLPAFLWQLSDHAGQRTSSTSSQSCRNFGVKTFQAEDEIAAIGAAIGASYGGHLGLTGTSGPGLALKSEALEPRRHDRATAGRHRRAARRPEHRHADQDRTVRPAPGDVSAATATRPSPSLPRRHPRIAS